MIQVIALTQFAFTALGSLAAIVLTRAQSTSTGPGSDLRNFIAANTLWMLLVPLVWMILASVAMKQTRIPNIAEIVRTSGVTLAALIGLTYGWLILTY